MIYQSLCVTIETGENNDMSVTDIHMHVIPGVDDGARNLEESLTMLELSASQGIETVIATPHN